MQVLVLLLIVLVCLQMALSFKICRSRSLVSSTRLYARSDPKTQRAANEAYKKAQMYLKMKQLREARENGLSLEEYKAKLKSGEAFTSNAGEVGTGNDMANISDSIKIQEAKEAYGPKKGYKKFVGAKGSLDSRLRNVIAYKRTSMSAENMVVDGETGMTARDERELEAMMEDDYGDDVYFDEEDAEYEQAVMKAIETNKLNELKRNFQVDGGVYDKAMEKRIDDGSDGEEEEEPVDRTKTATGLDVIIPGAGPAGWSAFLEENGDSEGGGDSSATTTEGEKDKADTTTATTTTEEKRETAKKEVYKPKSSSWGVFERPADISKAYGGGRVLTKKEMDAMDAEWEARQAKKDRAIEKWKTTSMKEELAHEPEITAALTKARVYMRNGNRKSAVETLESVQNYCAWTSDMGGEVLLELAMSLETVDRIDEARKIYGKLAATSWSPTIKRNALQLISGLDITKQIRNDVKKTQRSAMDVEGMNKISEALEAGLSNGWDDWGEGSRSRNRNKKANLWYDDGKEREGQYKKIDSFRDAYFLLEEALNPLRSDKVPSNSLVRALVKMYLAPESEKYMFLRSRGQHYALEKERSGKGGEFLSGEAYLRDLSTNPREGTFFASIGLGAKMKEREGGEKENIVVKGADMYTAGTSSSSSSSSSSRSSSGSSKSNSTTTPGDDTLGTGGAMAGFFTSFENNDSSGFSGFRESSGSATTTGGGRGRAGGKGDELKSVSEVYYKHLNGSWDLALSIQERPPYSANRLESGAVRRTYDIKQGTSSEIVPTFWGLSSSTSNGRFKYNGPLSLLEVSGDIITRTAAPTYAYRAREQGGAFGGKKSGASANGSGSKPKEEGGVERTGTVSQTVQIVYADDTMLITREAPNMSLQPAQEQVINAAAGRGRTGSGSGVPENKTASSGARLADSAVDINVNEQMRVSDPDLYLLWKKCKPVQYNRFYTK